jgi:hypothetical protein
MKSCVFLEEKSLGLMSDASDDRMDNVSALDRKTMKNAAGVKRKTCHATVLCSITHYFGKSMLIRLGESCRSFSLVLALFSSGLYSGATVVAFWQL